MSDLTESTKPNSTSALEPMWTTDNVSDSSGASKMNDLELLYKKVIFVLIAVVAILGNSLFCAVLVRKRASLRRPYNKLLLSLSVTDLLTGKLMSRLLLASSCAHTNRQEIRKTKIVKTLSQLEFITKSNNFFNFVFMLTQLSFQIVVTFKLVFALMFI